MTEPAGNSNRLRLDKWLWAARFFKTRSQAKAAIEGGKVQMGGHKLKVSKEVAVGDVLQIRQGWDQREVLVTGLDEQRRGAPEARLLYEETPASIARREAEATARKAAGGMIDRPPGRPDKKQRRQIHRFKHSSS